MRKGMSKKMKTTERLQAPGRRRLANGAYAIAVTGIVIAAAVLLNFIVAAVPAKYTTFDLTEQKLYSIGETTRELLNALPEDVTLYFLTENGQEDEGVEKLLDSYGDASPRVKVERIDVVVQPAFSKKYSAETVSLNSVIAVSGEKSKIADYSEFYQYDYSSYGYAASAYDAEGRITSAIAYVTGDTEAKVYYTTGHGEMELGAQLTDAMEKAHIEAAAINLLSETIPSDCTALFIFAPAQDLTEDEAKKVLSYLYGGGHAMLVSMPFLINGAETPNYDSILAAYGIARKEGIVLEGDAARYVQAPYLLVPELSALSEVTAGLANQNVIYSLAEALELPDTDDEPYTVTSMMGTSGKAYIKTDIDRTLEREDGDTAGAFSLAAVVEQTFSRDSYGVSDIPEDHENATEAEEEAESVRTRLLCFTTPCAFNSDALSSLIQQSTALPEGNHALITRCLTYLTDQETAVSVPAKTLYTPQTTIDTGTVNIIGNLLMFVLPAAVLGLGFAVFLSRRKR